MSLMFDSVIKMTFTNVVSKAFKLLRSIFTPFQFGFIQCHSYLTERQLGQIKSLLYSKDNLEKQQVILEFEERFGKLVGPGMALSFASGRMAFYALMETLGIGEGDEVIITAFTCSVMPNAVMKRGAVPVYADMDKDTFGSNANAIQKVITSKTRLIVAQHSFGIPCDIEPIIRLAKEHRIYVVEDCAISLDSSLNGIKVGNWGDAAFFSTDHSKPLNTIIGGVLYTQNPVIHEGVGRLARISPQLSHEHQQNLHQKMLFERKHYIPTRYPRAWIFSFIAKIKSKILGAKHIIFLEDNYTSPSSKKERYPYPAAMPAFLALLGIFELERWNMEKARRKSLLSILVAKLQQSALSASLPAVYSDSTRDIVPLRFVFTSTDSRPLIQQLGQYIDVNWIWFRKPITCAIEGMKSLNYISGSCSVSEEIGREIVNFPCNITERTELDLHYGIDQALGRI